MNLFLSYFNIINRVANIGVMQIIWCKGWHILHIRRGSWQSWETKATLWPIQGGKWGDAADRSIQDSSRQSSTSNKLHARSPWRQLLLHNLRQSHFDLACSFCESLHPTFICRLRLIPLSWLTIGNHVTGSKQQGPLVLGYNFRWMRSVLPWCWSA